MHIHTITCPPLETNTYLLTEESSALVIDPSCGSYDKILPLLTQTNCAVLAVLLTHSHIDHIADVHAFAKQGLPIYVHPLDKENIENPGSDGIPLFFPVQTARATHFFCDGEVLHLGPFSFSIIHTPGHSPGGVCLYFAEENTLFSGDTLFKGSIGNLSFPSAEVSKMWTSLKKLAQLPENTRVYPGHGQSTRIGDEPWLSKAEQYFS